MEKALKIIIGLFALMLLVIGLKTMVFPMEMIEKFGLDPIGTNGLNTVRGLVGGLLLGSSLMIITGIRTGKTLWFLPAALLMITVAAGRFLGLVVDGFDRAVLPPLVVEIVIASLLILASRRNKYYK